MDELPLAVFRSERVTVGAMRLSVLHAELFRFPAPWTFPPSELPYSILRLVHSGSGEIAFDGARHTVTAGDLVFIHEGAVLSCRATSPDFSFGSIRFSASLDAQGSVAVDLAVPPVSHVGGDATLRANFDAVIDAWENRTAGRALLASGHLAVVLGTAVALMADRGMAVPPPSRHRGVRAPVRARDPRIARVVDALLADVRRTPDVAALCALAHMSESTLRRTFKEQTGKTIVAFLREARIGIAARRLALGDDPVARIAADVGMPDANYFARSFRDTLRVSPTEYRRLTAQT